MNEHAHEGRILSFVAWWKRSWVLGVEPLSDNSCYTQLLSCHPVDLETQAERAGYQPKISLELLETVRKRSYLLLSPFCLGFKANHKLALVNQSSSSCSHILNEIITSDFSATASEKPLFFPGFFSLSGHGPLKN